MKKLSLSQFVIELLITALVAIAIAALVQGMLYFVVGNISPADQTANAFKNASGWIGSTGGIVMGLMIGYKLHSLVRHVSTKQPKRKK